MFRFINVALCLGAVAVFISFANAAPMVWTQSDGVKVRPTDPAIPANATANIYGARGETVSFQIIVTADSGSLSNVNVGISDLSDGSSHVISRSNIELFREIYVILTQKSDSAGATGEFPDGLVPIGADPYYHENRNGAPFPVAANRNQGIWVDVAIPAATIPGNYRGTVSITAAGSFSRGVPVSLTVWNFTIPATASLPTAFGLDTWQTYQGHFGSVWNSAKILTLTKLYEAEGLKHRISLNDNDIATPDYDYDPVTHKITRIDFRTFDSTLAPDLNGTLLKNGAKGTVAQVPFGNADPPGPTSDARDQEYVAYWKAISSHFRQKGWFDRNFLYTIDEPSTNDDFLTARHRADMLHQADPALRAMVTTALDSRLIGHINIWCPIVNYIDSPDHPGPAQYAARQKLGEKVWFYHSDSSVSHGEWPDFFVDRGTNSSRIFAWIAWRYHLDGFLYYATTITYTQYPNPWTNVQSFGDNGDGILFYPGRTSLIGGKHDIPCPSIRLKLIRAALQDYEYMMLLHNRGQDVFLDTVVRHLVTKANQWNHHSSALESARRKMAAKILSP